MGTAGSGFLALTMAKFESENEEPRKFSALVREDAAQYERRRAATSNINHQKSHITPSVHPGKRSLHALPARRPPPDPPVVLRRQRTAALSRTCERPADHRNPASYSRPSLRLG